MTAGSTAKNVEFTDDVMQVGVTSQVNGRKVFTSIQCNSCQLFRSYYWVNFYCSLFS